MASVWKRKDTDRWYIGVMSFKGRDGKRRQRALSAPADRFRDKRQAERAGEEIERAIKYLEGDDFELEAVYGARAREHAVHLLVEWRVVTQAQADAYMATSRVDLLVPEPVEQTPVLEATRLELVIEAYLDSRKVDLGNNTRKLHKHVLEHLMACHGPNAAPADAVSEAGIRRYFEWRAARAVKSARTTDGARSHNLHRSVLNAFAQYCGVNRMLLEDVRVLGAVKKRKEDRSRRELLSPTQIRALLHAAADLNREALAAYKPKVDGTKMRIARSHTDWGIMIRILLETGLRKGELCHLQWSDIIFEGERAPRLLVRNKPQFGWRVKDCELRELPLREETARMLRVWRDELPPRFQEPRAFLVTYCNRPFHPVKDAESALKLIFKKAGVTYSGYHLFRHTFAMRCVRSRQVDVIQLQQLLGHDRAETTGEYFQWAADLDLVENMRNAIPLATIGLDR